MISSEEIKALCLAKGCNAAEYIQAAAIPLDKAMRAYCEMNTCGQYGRNYACPPYCGQAEACMKRIKGFSHAVVFQTVSTLEDSYDFEGMTEAAKKHRKISLAVREAIVGQDDTSLMLSAGGCNICQECSAIKGEPCKCPESALSSLEAYCINVSKLAELCGMNYINGANTVTYFSVILY